MTGDQFKDIRAYDELESLLQQGKQPIDVARADQAADLAVLHMLESHARSQEQQIPNPETFRQGVMKRVRPDRYWWGYLVAAAVLLFAAYINFQPTHPRSEWIIDREMLEQVMETEAREAMYDYLMTSEKLLISLRQPDLSCTKDQVNVVTETELAKDLLIRQKYFTTQLNSLEYFELRDFFSELEMILVDLNTLDRCTDLMEVESIKDHINETHILTKLRLIAQEIHIS